MSSRQTNPGIHIPITDPEAILPAAGAEQRRVKLLAAHHTAKAAAFCSSLLRKP
ncbi:hypothetical protein PCASD_23958 [Puccinia coronata f. sp. avenae]|uniref:Uncharacterized protein n=1 Tax=Puccinia coronata f. sp. avenae TaxID=200324 RepID=A0A2N5U104_9BASI|nr:hypothetical protein PCASD_23958 [Puccinia coronata f. sp. avenae]